MQEAEESFIYISQIDVLHFYIKKTSNFVDKPQDI
jgi:hypothetical protein